MDSGHREPQRTGLSLPQLFVRRATRPAVHHLCSGLELCAVIHTGHQGTAPLWGLLVPSQTQRQTCLGVRHGQPGDEGHRGDILGGWQQGREGFPEDVSFELGFEGGGLGPGGREGCPRCLRNKDATTLALHPVTRSRSLFLGLRAEALDVGFALRLSHFTTGQQRL